MRARLFTPLAILAVALGHGCSWLPTTPQATGKTSTAAGGAIRQFFLPPGNPSRLDLPTAQHLLFAVSASESSAPSFQFRIQSLGTSGESRFRASDARLLAEPGALDRPSAPRRIQGGEPSISFWVNTGDSTLAGDRLRPANLRPAATTAHAYFYVDADPGAEISDGQLRQLADAFEQRIYPTVTGAIGPDPRADLTGEQRVYVVLSPAVDNFGQDKGLMGYFWSRDMLAATPVATSPRYHSNQKKVIFLTSRIFQQQSYTTFGTLAHEFTHLCVFNQKVLLKNRNVPEDAWLDEGWAMLSMDLCGYGLRAGNEEIAKDIKSFLDDPTAYSLTDWFNNPHGFSYGLSYLFTRYLYDRFGPGVIADIQAWPDVGVDAVNGALAKRQTSFQDVFADWALTNAVSGLTPINDKRFSYAPDINLRASYGQIALGGIRPTPVASFPKSLPTTLRPWGTAYYDLQADAAKAWSFEFSNRFGLFGSALVVP